METHQRERSNCGGNPPVNSYILNPITFGWYTPNKADAVMGHGERAPRTKSFIHFSYTNSSRFTSSVSRILSRDEIIPVPLPVLGSVNSFATSKIVNHVWFEKSYRVVKYNFSLKIFWSILSPSGKYSLRLMLDRRKIKRFTFRNTFERKGINHNKKSR